MRNLKYYHELHAQVGLDEALVDHSIEFLRFFLSSLLGSLEVLILISKFIIRFLLLRVKNDI